MHPAAFKLFVEVADSGSLTKVAVQRRTAQSNISRQISDLEAECGGRLFHRTGRGVVLTELGERILPRVRAWLAETDQLINDIKDAAGIPIGEVRIGTLPSTAHPLITTLYKRVRQQFPHVMLSVREGQSVEIEKWVEIGSVDLAILFRYAKAARDNEKHLATANTYLVGSVNDVITRSPTVPFSQLAGLPLILPCRPSTWRNLLDDVSRRNGISLSVVLEADSLTIQKELVAKGGVYTVLGPYAIAREVESGQLQAARILDSDLKRFVTLAISRHGPLTLACRIVAQLIQEIVKESERGG